MIIENLVTSLGEKYNISFLKCLNETQGQEEYRLFCDDLQLSCFEASGKFHLSAKICVLPTQDSEYQETVQSYLKLALAYMKRYPVSFSVEDEHLIVFYQLPLRTIEYATFEAIVEEFFNAIAFFKQSESAEPVISRPALVIHP